MAGQDRVARKEKKNPSDPAVRVAQAPLTPPLDRWRQGRAICLDTSVFRTHLSHGIACKHVVETSASRAEPR